MYKIDGEGNVSKLPVGPAVAFIKDCSFAQTTLRHLDAVIDIKVKPDTNNLTYDCKKCKLVFGGPKRLERHVCIVKSEQKLPSVIPNTASTAIVVLSDSDDDEDSAVPPPAKKAQFQHDVSFLFF